MATKKQEMCQAPDRDCPKMVCGYPLPCPWHNRRQTIKVAVIVNERKGVADRRENAPK